MGRLRKCVNSCVGKSPGSINKKCEKIFVAGLTEKTGCTHFSILIGNYFAIVQKKKVAIIHFDKNRDYENLIAKMGMTYDNKAGGYTKGRITYYPDICNTSKNRILNNRKAFCEIKNVSEGITFSEIISKGFEIVIIDAGSNYCSYMVEAGMSDTNYLFVNCSKWKVNDSVTSYLENIDFRKGEGRWRLVCAFGDKESISYAKAKMGIDIYKIPYISNPYNIDRKNLQELSNYLRG